MPPKPKNTKQEVIEAALEIIRREGIDALTARRLGKALNASASSIFTHFSSMEELTSAATQAVREIYNKYVDNGLAMVPPFKGFAIEIIHFAKDEPNFFAMLFMKRQTTMDFGDFIGSEGNEQKILDVVCKTFNINPSQAKQLYHNLWLYTHGIATLTATGVCSFTKEEISEKLGNMCRGTLLAMFASPDERTKMVPSLDNKIDGSLESYFEENAL